MKNFFLTQHWLQMISKELHLSGAHLYKALYITVFALFGHDSSAAGKLDDEAGCPLE